MKKIYLAGLIFLLIACNTNEDQSIIESQVIVESINPMADKLAMGLLNEVIHGTISGQRILNSDIGSIDLSEALKVEHLIDGVTRYTFLLDSDEPLSFRNLIIRVSNTGEVYGYQLIYRPSLQWISSNDTMDLNDFTGTITLANVNGLDLVEAHMAAGASYEIVDVRPLENGRVDCDGSGSGGTGGGGDGEGTGEGTGGEGSGEDGSDGDGADGSGSEGDNPTGGGTEEEENNDPRFGQCWSLVNNVLNIDGGCLPFANTNPEVARGSCDPGPMPEGDCMDDDCPMSPVGVLDTPLLCPEGQVMTSGGCQCENGTDDSGLCLCPYGFELVDGNCLEICERGFIRDEMGECIPQEKPCEGNPVVAPEIAPQSASGIQGGLFGCTRGGSGCGGDNAKKYHGGVDLLSEFGDPVFAMYDGTAVLRTQYNEDGIVSGAGYYVNIFSTIDGKTVRTSYFHLQQNGRVSGYVEAGDIIGYQGNSGNLGKAISSGMVDSHVHIKVKEEGITVDPLDHLGTIIDKDSGEVLSDPDC